ncbi:DUF2326 domain-containing protein [Sulfuricurvum sp.]|uniref:DUF2326 domain-containing protein n=1 Tax=Sulfuricurvum sp. TaxID=2025608 RepID=UPI00262A7790|nr:DUF2326 domain-containing protein [Sulfuricurvum sp.]MDD2265853.1 DUF2326 domain-containing protein [Sulfuricurvum sp.]MDD2784609.1 DUF2326 domain-containing protein [Sulfuricurvum sp.]
MRLIQLSSSDPRFKAITFTPGLNIIVGEKVLTDDKKKTSNGIGKSLSLICIDFLLGKGSQSKEIKKLKEVLEKEKIILTLNFEHNGVFYEVSRSHNKIWLNDVEYKKDGDYTDFLNTLVKEDTFRNIFCRFFRTDKKSYQDAISQVSQEAPYSNNKINAYLLGLNLSYLEKKKELKVKNDRLKVLIKELNAIEKTINKEKEFELGERLQKIEKDLENFEIAEDFNDLKKEADSLTAELQKVRNLIAFNNREIRNKKNIISVNQQTNIDIDKLTSMYEEAKFFLGEDVLAHIQAVKGFHETLFSNRRTKAINDIAVHEKEVIALESQSVAIDLRRSEIFKYLENKGALEEYHSLNKEKDKIKLTLEEIQRNQKTLKAFKKEQADIKIEIDQFKRDLIELEDKIKDRIEFLGKSFREISEEHYDDKPGLLEIKINEDFKTEKLYNIEANIKGDGSDGINEMKIFIYDMLIYKLNPTLICLVGHDNRLFDMVDERQIAKAFHYVSNNLSQYICSISDTKIDEVKKHISLNWDEVIKRNLSEKDKLFGFDFDQ